ncbi:DUF2281 [Desulfonema limicola]|uniref:DUF2281 n=1 Tax=Desulfonema limicola TaxID=45656 RepID=A0A975B609_9BACT|nr:DUF2281 domain-containing protein [Desulfonema limicola]QTA79400.1 DUF2281 [Desulfonema limicola]
MNINEIEYKIQKLPEHIIPELSVYIDFLIKKHSQIPKKSKPDFKWEGGISELKTKYSSVSLQKKSLEWR